MLADKYLNSYKFGFYCDVLVVGGGLAALAAAISAVDNGANVLLVNKGISGKSGSSAKAAGILAAAFGHGDLETRPVPDNPNKHARDTLAVGYHIGDPELVNFVAKQATRHEMWSRRRGLRMAPNEALRTDKKAYLAPSHRRVTLRCALGLRTAIGLGRAGSPRHRKQNAIYNQ